MPKFYQNMKRLAAALVLIAIVCSLYVGVVRIQNEQDYKNVNLSVNETDVRALANGNGLTNEEMLAMLKERGVSQILFKESTLGSLENAGAVQIALGPEVKTLDVAASLPDDLPISEGNYYVVVTDDSWREQVLKEVPAKINGATAYDNGAVGVVTIPTAIEATASNQAQAKLSITNIGVGFDQEWAETVAGAGFDLIAQVSSWDNPTEPALGMLADDIKALPNLAMLMFNDKSVPGYPDEDMIEVFYQALLDDNGQIVAPLGQIEFNNQEGFNTLANLCDKNVVRLHTISNAEMSNFEGDNEETMQKGIVDALDRWDLAARERNMRALLVRFFSIDMPGSYFDTNMNYLESLNNSLQDHGFNVGGEVQDMGALNIPPVVRILIGAGICAGFALLLMELGFRRLALAGFGLSLVAWVGLYVLNQTLAMQIMALVSVIEFPILSCLTFLPPKKDLSLPKAIGMMLALCAVSWIGAVLMVGVLSDKAFMLKLSSFVGVKIAHVIPLVVVPFVLYIVRDKKPLALCKNLLNKALDYKWAIIFAVVAVALMIYVTRTGNESGQISGLEAAMRQFLNDTMGVRPRSKEFLIGYPATILYLMYASRHKALWVLTLPLVIGQISLVNTYAHIHTPLLIALHRSLNGLILGIVVAVLAVLVVKLGIRLYQWAYDRLSKREA
ncbi:MAG: DUF5693 family protein [Peptococcaceae bacterium]|nr:DUF5693 family protein [Peptococcaceae bacterium]